jgi:hypothetical protein
VRDAAQILIKRSKELSDSSDVLIRKLRPISWSRSGLFGPLWPRDRRARSAHPEDSSQASRLTRSVVQPSFPHADAHRLDVELLLEPVEHLVADRAPVSQSDQCPALGGQSLVA